LTICGAVSDAPDTALDSLSKREIARRERMKREG
jgi:hypothetical protein